MLQEAVTYASADGSPDDKNPFLRVEVAQALRMGEMGEAWRDLVRRAVQPNVFMEPAFVRAAAHAKAAGRVWFVLVWDSSGPPSSSRLLGAWAFVVTKPNSGLPLRMLRAPVDDKLAFLATPVIDADHVEAVLAAMLDALAAHPRLPKLMLLSEIAEGRITSALRRVLRERGSAPAFLRQTRRPILVSSIENTGYFERSVSSATRKKLRQHRRRLAKHGPLAFVSHREPEDVCSALEDVLLLQDVTSALLADSQISVADSCCHDEESYIADFWKERQRIADVLIDVRRGGSLAFTMTRFCERAYREARQHLKSAIVKTCGTRK